MNRKKDNKLEPTLGKIVGGGDELHPKVTLLTNRVKLLKRAHLFHSLTDADIHDFSSKVIIKEFKKNQTILREQDVNEFMYIILQGKVKIYQISDAGKEIILSMHTEGDFFGEMSLIDGQTDPATVAALEPSQIAIISRPNFYYLLHSQKQILENLLELLCSRLRESWKKIQMLNYNDATQRIKMLFIMLSENYGEKKADGTTLRIKLIHQNIADMTGLTRETVTRVIDKWKNDGELSMTKDKYIHLNPEFETIQL